MFLSRLTVFGFKSFVNKVDIEFRGGITAVVGPNGCGKTNIVDAIRWAIGETRPSAMRSSRMEDVIFTGSRNRKPLGMAEVSLTIANDKKVLPVEFSEVTVTRRLFRSGESDYLLNRIPCRLMDIHTLFMDTGLGAHAYSVFEQGMVDAIISDRAEERRLIFEEAAGITRYKVRRKSAWNKLQSIHADLQRIEDIVGEVERQVNSLRRQMRKARLYKTYSEQVTDMEIRLGRFRYFQWSREARPVLEEIQFLKDDLEVGAGDLARSEARLENLRADLAEQEQALSIVNEELSRQQATVHAKDRDVSVARESIRGIEAFLERASRGRSELARRLETAEQSRGDVGAELEQAQKSSAQTLLDLKGSEEVQRHAENLLEETRSHVEADKTRLIALLQQRSDRSGKLERARAERDGLVGRRTELESERDLTATRAEVSERSAKLADADIRDAEPRMADALGHMDLQSATLARKQERIGELTEEQNGVHRRIEGRRARLHLLERLREGFEGYSQGVRALAIESPHADRVRGIVADLIDTEDAYSVAVETALGYSLEALVVSETAEAKAAIRYLKEGGKGRAAFWALDRVSAGDSAPQWEVPAQDGVLGRGCDLVRCDPEYALLVRRLLGRTLVVRDMAAATALPPIPGIDIVTLDGDLLAADGLVAGGRSGAEQGQIGLIGRRQQIVDLRRGLEQDEGLLVDLGEQIAGARNEAKDLAEKVRQAEDRIDGLRARMSELEMDRHNSQEDVRRLKERLTALLEEDRRIRSLVERLDQQVAIEEGDLRRLDEELAGLERLSDQHSEDLRQAEAAVHSSRESADALRLRDASMSGRVEELRREAARHQTENVSLVRQLEGTDAEIDEAAGRRKAVEAQRLRDEEEMKGHHEALRETEARRDGQADRHQELALTARGLDDEIRGLRRKHNEKRERLHELELRLQEIKAKADALRERLLETHRVDINEMGPPADEGGFGADTIEKRVFELQEKMRRLGAVNMAALEDYEAQKERYGILTKHRNDLLEADETLRKTIARIDRTARSRFTETFEKVRESFKSTFTLFFEGGEADLWMEPNQDPLEAPIFITARPRGKRLQHINLLSGGERALTAIALLFSIYLVKPSPFCILDEVDAPLDDANIERFTRVLKRFAEETQFIVVTHNKKTMEAAESLHGVTMEEPGISKLVSVRIGRNGRSGSNGDGKPVVVAQPV